MSYLYVHCCCHTSSNIVYDALHVVDLISQLVLQSAESRVQEVTSNVHMCVHFCMLMFYHIAVQMILTYIPDMSCHVYSPILTILLAGQDLKHWVCSGVLRS